MHVRIRELESTVAACESAIGHEMARVAELEAELVEARRHEHEAIEAYDRQYARAERAERERDATFKELARVEPEREAD